MDLENEAREALLGAHLAFLYTPELSGLGLAIAEVELPGGPTRMATLAWPIVIDNTRGRMSEGFRVGYQVLDGEKVVATVSLEEPPLAGGSQRVVDLPSWEPSREGDFRLRFGLAAEADSMVYGLTRHL